MKHRLINYGRSKAVQIGANLGVLEQWVVQMGLPHGVQKHLDPVRDLLSWLQVRYHYLNEVVPPERTF